MKIVSIPAKYKFPVNMLIQSYKEQEFFHTESVIILKRDLLPKLCLNGWFVIDWVKKSKHHNLITLGKMDTQAY